MSDLETIRKLRSLCGASITSCKKALETSGGDFDQALEILKKEGIEIARKKSERETRAGAIDVYLHPDRRLAACIKVKSETDFVAKNKEFLDLVHELAMQVAASDPADVKELLGQPFIKDQTKTVSDLLKENIVKFGENIEIDSFSRIHF